MRGDAPPIRGPRGPANGATPRLGPAGGAGAGPERGEAAGGVRGGITGARRAGACGVESGSLGLAGGVGATGFTDTGGGGGGGCGGTGVGRGVSAGASPTGLAPTAGVGLFGAGGVARTAGVLARGGTAPAACPFASSATTITPPHTEQRARTLPSGTFAGSIRKTDRHSGHTTFTAPPSHRMHRPVPRRPPRVPFHPYAGRPYTRNPAGSWHSSSSRWPIRSSARRGQTCGARS